MVQKDNILPICIHSKLRNRYNHHPQYANHQYIYKSYLEFFPVTLLFAVIGCLNIIFFSFFPLRYSSAFSIDL